MWTAIIQAHGIHGKGQEALELFNHMQEQNIKPSEITLTCVLSACSHSGMVEQAWDIYNSIEQFGIIPTFKHQACMVDVLGRAGMLEQAENFINNLPNPHISVWQALLGASRNRGDVQRAQRTASQILKLDPRNAASLVLLANTHAAAGNWNESTLIWSEMVNHNIKKMPGTTWVTINGRAETFYVDAWDHPYPANFDFF